MADELWGVGADARRAARPVVLSLALGTAAFTLTFCAAVALGRGLAGSALAALLVPLALSGALAVGLSVAFVVAIAMEQASGPRRVRATVAVVTPLAALVALFVYASEPSAQVGRTSASGGAPDVLDRTPYVAPGPRSVSVPPATVPPAEGAPVGGAPVGGGPVGGAPVGGGPVGGGPVGGGPVAGVPDVPGVATPRTPVVPGPVAGPVVGPVVPERPVVTPAEPDEPDEDPREVPPRTGFGPAGPDVEPAPSVDEPKPKRVSAEKAKSAKSKVKKPRPGKPRRGCPPAPKAKAKGCTAARQPRSR